MQISSTTSVMKVGDHDAAVRWYAQLFDREPDRRPMPPSAEWNLGTSGAVQVYLDPEHAGGHDMIIAVEDVDATLAELAPRGITGDAFTVPSGQFRLALLADPSGNQVILANDLITVVRAPERHVARRTVSASPSVVFSLLTDPSRHQETEPTDWVRSAVTTDTITAVGQVFAVNMFLDVAGGDYVMHNLVTAFVPDRTIAWLPGALDDTGSIGYGGWWWRYDLTTSDEGTVVTLTYDWTDTPEPMRAEIGGLPAVPASFLDASLASLDKALSA